VARNEKAHAGRSKGVGDEDVDLKTLEDRYIAGLMEKHSGDKEKVADILGISVRSLYRKIND
jgi:transcriptional regulator with PAS, ATPase and Fis domain